MCCLLAHPCDVKLYICWTKLLTTVLGNSHARLVRRPASQPASPPPTAQPPRTELPQQEIVSGTRAAAGTGAAAGAGISQRTTFSSTIRQVAVLDLQGITGYKTVSTAKLLSRAPVSILFLYSSPLLALHYC